MAEFSFFEAPMVIGEIAQAHDGSLGLSHSYIDAIAEAGAGAVKFQTHIAAEESTVHEPWRVKFSRQDVSRWAYWKRMEFTKEQWQGLARHAGKRGLVFLSSPFSNAAVEVLSEIGVSTWKIASGELTNQPMLEQILKKSEPVILSTGMARYAEIDRAVSLVESCNVPYAVVQCTSVYPTPAEKIGLNLIEEFRHRYECPVGISDHSGTIYPSLAAAALGGKVFEVHVTFSRKMFGPDVPASITVEELSELVEGIDVIHRARSNPVNKDFMADELMELRDTFTKSIVASQAMERGHVLKDEDLQLKKPGSGMPAECIPEVLGRRLKKNIDKDELLSSEHLE